MISFFFFNDTATTEIYTLSLHDALPISNLRNRAFDVMQRLPIAYFDHQPAGKIATRIVNDTETLKNQFYDNLLSQIIVSLSQIIFIYVVMIYLDVKSGLLLLLIMPLFYGMQRSEERRVGKECRS